MKRRRFSAASMLLVLLLGLFSCAQDDDYQVKNKVVENELNRKNLLMRDYAMRLAVAVAQDDVRQLIYEQVTLKFDGDYEVLIKNLESVRMEKSDRMFGELMDDVSMKTANVQKVNVDKKTLLESGGVSSTSVTSDDLLTLTEDVPNVQLAMPVHCDTWNPETQIPLVAVRPIDYVEEVGARIEAFDAQGNVYYLSADEEPDFPVLVVGRSERVNEDGQLDTTSTVVTVSGLLSMRLPVLQKSAAAYPEELILTHGFSKSLLLEWVDVDGELGYEVWRMNGTQFEKIAQTSANDNNYVDANLTPNVKYWYKIRAVFPESFSSWSPVMATTASSRSDNEWLKIKRMRFSSSALKAVEQWISGAPEIRLRVVQGSSTGASTVFTSGLLEPKNRSSVVDSWWNKEVAIFAWSTSVYGTVLTFDWREEDWYNKVDFSLTGSYEDKRSGGTVKSGGTVEYENDEGGDIIGNTSVMWWQEKTQLYDLSGFQWQFVY
jgi:hypothetical protein